MICIKDKARWLRAIFISILGQYQNYLQQQKTVFRDSMTPSLRFWSDFDKKKKYMNDNKMKMQLCVKYDLRGHWRWHKGTFLYKNQLFLRYIFCLKSYIIKPSYECQHYEDIYFSYDEVWPKRYDLKGHLYEEVSCFLLLDLLS